MMFPHYDKKDKWKWLILNFIVISGIVGMGYLAVKITNVEIVTVKEKASFGVGAILIFVLVILALTRVINVFWRFKGLGFALAFVILLLFKSVIDFMIVSIGLISIPLLINDIMIRPYFSYLNVSKYWDQYRYLLNKRND